MHCGVCPYFFDKDKHHNASQEKFSSGCDRFGNVNMRDYGGSQPSGGGFGVSTRSNSIFGFGGVTSSGGGFGNTNQYQDGGNRTGYQGGSDGNLGHVHCIIFKMMEPRYKNFRGTFDSFLFRIVLAFFSIPGTTVSVITIVFPTYEL